MYKKNLCLIFAMMFSTIDSVVWFKSTVGGALRGIKGGTTISEAVKPFGYVTKQDLNNEQKFAEYKKLIYYAQFKDANAVISSAAFNWYKYDQKTNSITIGGVDQKINRDDVMNLVNLLVMAAKGEIDDQHPPIIFGSSTTIFVIEVEKGLGAALTNSYNFKLYTFPNADMEDDDKGTAARLFGEINGTQPIKPEQQQAINEFLKQFRIVHKLDKKGDPVDISKIDDKEIKAQLESIDQDIEKQKGLLRLIAGEKSTNHYSIIFESGEYKYRITFVARGKRLYMTYTYINKTPEVSTENTPSAGK